MEFTGLLTLKIEATIKAENKGEALSFFSDLIANISIDNYGKKDIEIVDDNFDLIESDWELTED